MQPEIYLSPPVQKVFQTSEDVSALVLEKAGYEDIIKQIMVQIEGHPEEQKAFITSLFATMAVEGDTHVTNMRDAAFTILAHSQIQSILKSNPGIVLQTYIQSIRKQSWENDPYSGSIATLLDAGGVIASTLRPNKRDRNRIIKAWQKVSQDMTEAEDKNWIDRAMGKIEHAVGPRLSTVELDNQVEALSNQGITLKQMAKTLSVSLHQISSSRSRLYEANRVERWQTGSTTKLDNQVEALSNQGGLSCKQMAEKLNVTLSKFNNSRVRLLKAGRVLQLKKGRPKKTS